MKVHCFAAVQLFQSVFEAAAPAAMHLCVIGATTSTFIYLVYSLAFHKFNEYNIHAR